MSIKFLNQSIQVDELVTFIQGQASSYRSNNVLLTMGEDFHYMEANMWFKNLDKIIK